MRDETLAAIPDEYRYLALLMGLPLVDGVFIAIVISGGLTSLFDAILVGSLVFGGGALVTVILSEFKSTRTTLYRTIAFGLSVTGAAMVQAALAPTLETLISTEHFYRGAMLALGLLALKILPIQITDYLPQPGLIVLVTLAISLQPQTVEVVFDIPFQTVLYAGVAGLVATGIAVSTITVRDEISDSLNPHLLRYGCAVGLLAVVLSLSGLLPSLVPLGIFAGSTVVALSH